MDHQWPLTGRQQELDFVERALTSTRGVLLAGAAGVRKIQLARDLADWAGEKGWHVEQVWATASTRDLPLGGGLKERAAGRRLVVVVDDAHLLDLLSAALAHHLATSGAATVLATARSGEPAPEPITALYKGGIVDRLEIQQLARNEVRDLLDAVLGGQVGEDTLRRLWAASDGNVLYLRKLVLDALDAGTLVDEGGVWRWSGGLGPARRLTEILGARLDGLTPSKTTLIELAVGEPLAVEVVDAIVQQLEMERP